MKLDRIRPEACLWCCVSLCSPSWWRKGAFAAAPAAETAADVETVTWAEHVAPIVYERCVSCHRPGQVAPMSLLTYDQARPWGKAIAKVTHDRTMPPWFANPEHGQFVEDSRLSDQQIEVLSRWVSAGMPAGDLAKAPQPPTFAPSGGSASRTRPSRRSRSRSATSRRPLPVAQGREPLDEERWIKALEVRPGFPEVVHHQLTYLGPPGATIEEVQGSGTARPRRSSAAGGQAWRRWSSPTAMACGCRPTARCSSRCTTTRRRGPAPAAPTRPRSASSSTTQPPENVMETLWLVDPALNIPPGEANYKSTSWVDFEHDAILFDFTPHMHLRGKSMVFTAEYRAARRRSCSTFPGTTSTGSSPTRRSSRRSCRAGTRARSRGRVRQLGRQRRQP